MKPIGLYDPGDAPPAWASFGTIADFYPDASFIAARRLSEQRGFLWVLQMGYQEPVERPIEAHAQRILAKLDRTGLRPYVIAVTVREEWYEHWRAGEFTDEGLPPGVPWGVSVIRDWASRQHAAIKEVFGPRMNVVWITTAANNNPAIQPYQPIPTHTDYVAVDAYVPEGGSFPTHVAPILEHAERTTHLPLVLIAHWFRHEGDAMWHHAPTEDDTAAYLDWVQRPRWIALLGFTWRSRGNGIVGAVDLPSIRNVLQQRLGSV